MTLSCRAERPLRQGPLRRALTVLAAACLAGCGASSDALLDRASVELRCPRERLASRVVDDALQTGRTVRVQGCGRGATYVQMCTGGAGEVVRECAWTR